ncbi:MAG: hypothetical protein WCD89_05855 [Anaerocolumna sp.]
MSDYSEALKIRRELFDSMAERCKGKCNSYHVCASALRNLHLSLENMKSEDSGNSCRFDYHSN